MVQPVTPAAFDQSRIFQFRPDAGRAGSAVTTQPTGRRGRRVALVIGNSAYNSVPALANPHKDAAAIAKSLRNIGFDTVTLATDMTRERLIDALRSFANDAETRLGNGLLRRSRHRGRRRQLLPVPVDAALAVDCDIEYEAVPLSRVLRATDGATRSNSVMLDACRDNPFAPRKRRLLEALVQNVHRRRADRFAVDQRAPACRSQGCRRTRWSCSPRKDGQIALDGEGGNSPFAVAVVQRIATPGVEINKVSRLVRDDVMEATATRQEPYTYGSLPGKEDFSSSQNKNLRRLGAAPILALAAARS